MARLLATAPDGPYDVVFADPPYAVPDADINDMLAGLVHNGWLAEEAVVVVERSSRDAPVGWVPGITGRTQPEVRRDHALLRSPIMRRVGRIRAPSTR